MGRYCVFTVDDDERQTDRYVAAVLVWRLQVTQHVVTESGHVIHENEILKILAMFSRGLIHIAHLLLNITDAVMDPDLHE